jgi:hypothetical protein
VTHGSTNQRNGPTRDDKPRLIDWLQTVPGIVTAVTGLIVVLAGVGYGSARLSNSATPRPTVTATAVTPTGPQSGAPAVSSTNDTSATQAPGSVFLDTLTPIQDHEDSGGGTASAAPQQIGTTSYPNSVRFNCASSSYEDPSYLIYVVAGYTALRVTIGVPNDAVSAAGNSGTLKFLKDGGSTQLSPQVTTALDQPQSVTVPLAGASQLEISCQSSAPFVPSGLDIVLGNAILIR